jgi:hypothetical protein
MFATTSTTTTATVPFSTTAIPSPIPPRQVKALLLLNNVAAIEIATRENADQSKSRPTPTRPSADRPAAAKRMGAAAHKDRTDFPPPVRWGINE